MPTSSVFSSFTPPMRKSIGGRIVESTALSTLSFVNDLATTYGRGSSAFNPITGETVTSNVRRRRTWVAGRRSFSLDLNEQNRTNICLRSNEIGTSPWTTANLSAVTQTVTDAYGNANTAWALTDTADAVSSPHVQYQQITKATSALPYTGQCEFKVLTLNTYFKLQIDVAAAIAGIRVVVGADGVITGQEAFGPGGWVLTKAIVTSLGGGWFRLVVSGTSGVENNIRTRPTIQALSGANNDTYIGTGTRSVAVARCQLEQAVHGSSYITTGAASASRAVEGGAWTMAHTIGTVGTVIGFGVPFLWEDNFANPLSFYVMCRSGSDVHGIYSVTNGATRTIQGFTKDAVAPRYAQWMAPSAVYTEGSPVVQVARRSTASVDLFHNGAQVATTPITTAPWTSFNTIGVGSTPASTSPFHGWTGIWTSDKALTSTEIARITTILRNGEWA